MKIGVIGAGIGGLVAAIGLSRAGAEVTVFERASSDRGQGSGLTLFGNAFAAFDSIGLGDDVRSIASDTALASKAGFRTPNGSWLSVTPPSAISAVRVVHRDELSHLLRERFTGLVHYDTTAAVTFDSESTTGSATVSAAGNEYEFDAVIAADGIQSRTRASWSHDPGLRYAGYSAWRGVTDRAVDLRGEAGEMWGRGERFGIAPLRDGRVYWFAVATIERDELIDDELSELRRRFAPWHQPVRELLDSTDPSVITRLPVTHLRRPLRSFHQDRTVLLGDAAHAMTPDLGQGAAQALEDAATISALLRPVASAEKPDALVIDDALVRYDGLRTARTRRLMRQARQLGMVAQLSGRFPTAIRNFVLRCTPDALIAGQLNRIQRWKPPAST